MRVNLAAAVCFLVAHQAAAQSVTTYQNSINRHGEYVVPGLTASAAANLRRDTAFDGAVCGHVYAQPLYWKPPGAASGRVIVAPESNMVEALDDTTGKIVWETKLAAPARLRALDCGNINPEGITGTPAIDAASGTIYFDAVTDVAPGVRHKVYALSASTGQVLPNWPVDVQDSLAGQGVAFT